MMQIKMWCEETTKRINRFMQLVGWGVTLGVISGLVIFIAKPHIIEYVNASTSFTASTTAKLIEPESKLALIKVVYNWTPERIEQEIRDVFPDVPIMYKVMLCESGGNNEAFNPTNGSYDNGLFQISDYYHGPRVRALGLDVGNPADNIRFARILYDEQGLQPWNASKFCWNK